MTTKHSSFVSLNRVIPNFVYVEVIWILDKLNNNVEKKQLSACNENPSSQIYFSLLELAMFDREIWTFLVQIVHRRSTSDLQIFRSFLCTLENTKQVATCEPSKLIFVPPSFIELGNLFNLGVMYGHNEYTPGMDSWVKARYSPVQDIWTRLRVRLGHRLCHQSRFLGQHWGILVSPFLKSARRWETYCALPATLAMWSTWSATAAVVALPGSATKKGAKLTLRLEEERADNPSATRVWIPWELEIMANHHYCIFFALLEANKF